MKAVVVAALGAIALAGCATLEGAPHAPLVDYHQHLVSPAFAPIVNFPVVDGAAAVARLDAAGIDRAVILSMGYSFADERNAQFIAPWARAAKSFGGTYDAHR